MTPQTFIFIGRSGCGKGTQAELLKEYLEKNGSNPVFYLESGERFREFISQNSSTADLSREIMKSGGLQPVFLAIHIWSHVMIEQMDKEKHLIIDGTPRKLEEAKILDGALDFYSRENPTIIFMNVSRKWSEDRLSGRGRSDDQEKQNVEKRLDWFDADVMPAVEYFRTNSKYKFLDINGEQTIEEVHEEIIQKAFDE